MITDIHYDFVTDVSRENDALVLEAMEPCLAAGVWTMLRQDRVSEARLDCLKYVVGTLCGRDSNWERWVIIGHRALQPGNAISKHLGIRKYLHKQGIRFETSEFLEQLHEYESGLRFVGATRWEMSDIDAINAAMMTERAVIVLVNGSFARGVITNIINNTWDVTAREPFGILNIAAQETVVVIDAYGEFDDREVAVAAIGRSEILQMLGIGEGGSEK